MLGFKRKTPVVNAIEGSLKPVSDQPGLPFFTAHKADSSLTNRWLKKISQADCNIYISLESESRARSAVQVPQKMVKG